MSGRETVIFSSFYSSAITQGLKFRDRRTSERCFHPKNYPASSREKEGKMRYGGKNTERYTPQRMWRISTGDIIYPNNGCSFHREEITSMFQGFLDRFINRKAGERKIVCFTESRWKTRKKERGKKEKNMKQWFSIIPLSSWSEP